MLKIILIIFATSIFLCSCVSQSDHDKIISEKEAIAQERDKLKQEIDEIKFGSPNLLADGKKFYEAKDFFSPGNFATSTNGLASFKHFPKIILLIINIQQ